MDMRESSLQRSDGEKSGKDVFGYNCPRESASVLTPTGILKIPEREAYGVDP